METLITVLIIIVCILLSIVVLIQNPKGGGLDSSFGSAAQLGGVQKTTDFLEKSTWTLVISLVVLCLASTVFNGTRSVGSSSSDDRFKDAPLPQQTQPAPTQQEAPAEPAQ